MKGVLQAVLGTDNCAIAVASAVGDTIQVEQYVADDDCHSWPWRIVGQMENHEPVAVNFAELAGQLQEVGFDVHAAIWERACFDCGEVKVLVRVADFLLCAECAAGSAVKA